MSQINSPWTQAAILNYRYPLTASPRKRVPAREETNLDSQPYREILLRLEREIDTRINAIDRDMRHEGMSADWTEQASERENDEVLESLGNSSEVELAQIREALRRIDSGEYFTCSECGEPIPTARLDLLPYTAHCVDCADVLEHEPN